MNAANLDLPWMMVDDFNDIVDSSERRGRDIDGGSASSRCNKFVDNINKYALMDLGCIGPKLTWLNGQEGLARTYKRLDRAMANAKWRIAFPESYVKNLPRTTSDHCPVFIFITGTNKINTDGGVNKVNGKCGFGGIIRDAAHWLGRFYGKLEECTSLEAEIHAMFVADTILETDSQIAFKMISEHNDTAYQMEALIGDVKALCNELKIKVQHTLREGNKCADFLAKLGASQELQFVYLVDPTPDLIPFLLADEAGTSYIRF